MDPTEDLSARILLKHILVTETPRTPVTRSETQGPSSSGVRRSNRLSNKDADARTPQSILRRSLRQKIHEDITRKSLPATKRRTASVVLRKIQTPAAASMFLSDGDTPRHLLRNILQMEPVKSPVVHEKGPSEEPDLPSADNTVTRTRTSIELSGLDLPDVTFSHAASTARGLIRKRPRRSLNVTAFEKRLKDGDDTEEEADNLTGDHSSLSLSSSTSLSLKTPFADVRTEKRGLKRRVSNRRKITVEKFGAAVNGLAMGVVSSCKQAEQDLSETTNSEGFTLGLSKLSEPDITVDIVNCNTALYDQPDAMTSNISIVATQDKPTVMASQLQRDMQEMEQEEEEEQRKLETEKSFFVFPSEEEAVAESQKDGCVSHAQLQEDVDESEAQNKNADDKQETAAVTSTFEEKDDAAGSQTVETDDRTESEELTAQTGEEGAADSHSDEPAEACDQFEGEQLELDCQTEEVEGSVESLMEKGESDSQSEDVDAGSQSDKQDITPDYQTEEQMESSLASRMVKSTADSQSEDVEAGSQSDEEEVALNSVADEEEECASELQNEDVAANSQSEDVEAGSQSEEEEVAQSSEDKEDDEEEECAAEFQNDVAANSQYEDVEVESQSDGDEVVAESLSEDDHHGEKEEEEEEQASEELEQISRRAHRSEGVLVAPVTEAGEELTEATATGWSDSKSQAHIGLDLNSSLEMRSQESSQPPAAKPDWAETSVEEPEDVYCPENDPEAGKENSFHLQGTHDIEVSGHLGDLSPEGIPAQDADEKEEEWEEDDDDDDDDDDDEEEEFPHKTPAFVKEKRNFFLPDPQASPSVFRNIQASSTTEAPAKARQVKQRKKRPSMKKTVLPKTYLMSVFKHFAKTKVSADVFPVLNDIMDKFFGRLADDLETFAIHAKRKTIDIEDAKLLLKSFVAPETNRNYFLEEFQAARTLTMEVTTEWVNVYELYCWQGYVNDKVPVEVLIEKYLRMEQRKLLIPIATSGNVVIPKRRR